MSKIIEWIKKDKMKASIIGVSSLMFIVGMVVVVANSGGTYALTTVTATFNGNGGTASSSSATCSYSDVQGNCTVTAPSATRSNYTFDGWSRSTSCSTTYSAGSSIPLASDTTYYACWTANSSGQESVNAVALFDGNGGTATATSKSCSGAPTAGSCTVTAPSATRSGYTFTGWSRSSSCSGTTYSANSSLTLTLGNTTTFYACWKDIQNNVVASFNANGGSTSTKSLECTYPAVQGNCTVTAPSATRSGYTFTGWSRTSDCSTTIYAVGSSIPLASDTTYYACWEDTSNIVVATFDANGGSTAIASRECTYSPVQGNCTVIAPAATRDGYTFDGWSRTSNCSTTIYEKDSSIPLASDTTYYACWSGGSSVTVTFKCASGGTTCAEGCGLPRTCYTEVDGTIDEECYNFISNKCGMWSENTNKEDQSDGIASLVFKTKTFDENIEYYCVSGTSNVNSCDVENPGTSTTPTDPVDPEEPETPTNACYVCSTNTDIMKWASDGSGDTACLAGYTVSEKVKSDCETVPSNPEDPDDPVIPTNACYVCSTDTSIMKWSSDGSGDTACSAGYTVSEKAKSDCETIPSNPDEPEAPKEDEEIEQNEKTGDALIIVAWLTGIGALGYAVYYYFRHRKMGI